MVPQIELLLTRYLWYCFFKRLDFKNSPGVWKKKHWFLQLELAILKTGAFLYKKMVVRLTSSVHKTYENEKS